MEKVFKVDNYEFEFSGGAMYRCLVTSKPRYSDHEGDEIVVADSDGVHNKKLFLLALPTLRILLHKEDFQWWFKKDVESLLLTPAGKIRVLEKEVKLLRDKLRRRNKQIRDLRRRFM